METFAVVTRLYVGWSSVGRKMMKGYLHAGGLRVGDKRIGHILNKLLLDNMEGGSN